MLGMPGDRGLPAVQRARDGLPARRRASTSTTAAAFTARLVDRARRRAAARGHAAQHQRARPATSRASRSRGSASASTATSSTLVEEEAGRQQLPHLRRLARARRRAGHRPRGGRRGPHRGHAAALRPHRPRTASRRCGPTTSRPARAGRARRSSERRSRGRAPPSCAQQLAAPRPPLLRPRRPRDRRRRLRRAARRAARDRAEHPELVTPDSPTQRVGGEPVSKLAKVTHLQPMLSLANARSEEELRAWVARMRSHLAREGIEDPDFDFVAEPKIDGLAISLVYRDGVLERGATRGNGEVGEDVTHNLRTIAAIPLRIDDAPPLLEVRGEVYMSLPDFTALNERRAEAGLSTFMNPRNSRRGHDPPARPGARRRAPAVDVVLRDRRHRGARASSSHWEALEWLREHGFRVNGDISSSSTEDEVVAQCLRLAGAPRRARLRDRRRRRQGRRLRAAAAARRRRAATRAGRSPGSSRPPPRSRSLQRDPLERRQVRRPAPVRRARARPRRRRDGQGARRCTTRRTSRARTSAPATT